MSITVDGHIMQGHTVISFGIIAYLLLLCESLFRFQKTFRDDN